jgi:acetyl-CoA synthetase
MHYFLLFIVICGINCSLLHRSFQFIGRNDDIFKANGGYRISPFELESDLIQHAAVLESAVVGVFHPVKGLVPKAFIVLNEGHVGDNSLTENILEFIALKRAGSHKIHVIEFVRDLPKTMSGKIRRVELREKK